MRRNHRRPGHRGAAEQLDLFGPSGPLCPLPGLRWEQLPEETRKTVTKLMAHLLVDHAGSDHLSDKAGGRSDV
jgi:hypothetical protein